jgi:hypothetical protein
VPADWVVAASILQRDFRNRRFGRILDTSTNNPSSWKDDKLAKPNYQYEKRQKDLAKKKKQEEKRLRKLEKHAAPAVDSPDQGLTPAPAPEQGETS